MDTVRFIHKHEVPADRFEDVTYIKLVCQIRTEKKDPYQTRATMDGNHINYPNDVGNTTATLLLIKILLNSVISMPGAQFANADISNFYLMTPLKHPEYAKVKLSDIPEEVIEEYKLHEKEVTTDGLVYMMVVQGMYDLPQAGSLGHDLLEKHLNKEGYFQIKIVPRLWSHKTRDIKFVLVVNDFRIKYIKQADLDHLAQALEKHYQVTVDKESKEFVKINLDWDYENEKVHLSMAPYILPSDNSTILYQSNAMTLPILTLSRHMEQRSNLLHTTNSPKSDQRNRNIFKRLPGNFCGMQRGRRNTFNSVKCTHLSTSQANNQNH
eukprot:CCRYP_005643-RA/>CCRYP_005643-RA protein AED:0.40 eAED:0.40 QI:0/0/0/1/0/0/2/0/323